jgi:SPX domain protein involved in polyphosphate accumulation
MPITTEIDLKELRDLVIGLREEMRVGFANNDTKLAEFKAEIKSEIQRVEAKTDVKFVELASKIDQVEAKTDVKFVELASKIDQVEAKTDVKFAELAGKIDVIDERTKLGFWGFVSRAIIISILGLMAGFLVKYFFFGTVKL